MTYAWQLHRLLCLLVVTHFSLELQIFLIYKFSSIFDSLCSSSTLSKILLFIMRAVPQHFKSKLHIETNQRRETLNAPWFYADLKDTEMTSETTKLHVRGSQQKSQW